MSKYTMYYNSKQIEYKNFAIKWSRWAETHKLAPYEMMGIKRFFRQIARRFGLIKEFKDIGVI